MAKTIISTATIVDPTGVPARIEIINPKIEHITETKDAQIVTDLKLLNNLMAERDGKITRAEIKSEPTRFMARTITTAIIMAITKL